MKMKSKTSSKKEVSNLCFECETNHLMFALEKIHWANS